LYVQKDVAPRVVDMLVGAMQTLRVGDPWQLATDVGPLIDEDARAGIAAYCDGQIAAGRLVARCEAPGEGLFVPPTLLEIPGVEALEREIFGPVLHVASFHAQDIDRVIDAINGRGYGLTFGLHTRIDARVQHIVDRVRAGNIYVNRNQIGAVVGSQPFGGEGLSGTGPKAGGPHYLLRFRKPLSAPLEVAEPRPAAISPGNGPAPRFPDARDWQRRRDRIGMLRSWLRGKASRAIAAAAALDTGPVDLPGPTGEANSISLHPRGNALCLGPDPQDLLEQVVQALAAGNAVIAVAPGASAALAALSGRQLPLVVVDAFLSPEAIAALPADVVALVGDSPRQRAIRQALARRDGPLTRIVTAPIDA